MAERFASNNENWLHVMEPTGLNIRTTAIKYYAWYLSFCIMGSVFFVVGSCLRSSLPLDSWLLCWVENLCVLIGAIVLVCVCIFFSMALLGIPQRVEVDEEGMRHRSSRYNWQEAREIEHLGDHLRVTWTDGSRTRVFYWRPLAPGSSMCSSGWRFWRDLLPGNLRFWQPLLELLTSYVVFPQARLMLRDVANGDVIAFHSVWFVRVSGLGLNWLLVPFITCLCFMWGASTDVGAIVNDGTVILVLYMVFIMLWTFRFAWVDQGGVGIFRPILGFKYIKFSKIVQLNAEATEQYILLRLRKDPENDVILSLWGIRNYLTLQALLVLKWADAEASSAKGL